MSSINRPRELEAVIHDPEELRSRSRSPLFLLMAVVAALLLSAALVLGFLYLRGRHAAQTLASEQQKNAQTQQQAAPQPLLKIFEDQAMIKGAQVIIGGTVQNISPNKLENLSLELELTRRAGGAKESRTIPLTPNNLASGEQGKYSLTVLSRDYKQARVARVVSGSRSDAIAFTTAPGAQRPSGPPASNNRTIIVNRPAQRDSNSDYINTPDNPTTIR